MAGGGIKNNPLKKALKQGFFEGIDRKYMK